MSDIIKNERNEEKQKNKTAAFHNLGCKVNSYETDAMIENLVSNGYSIVPFGTEADVTVINTCSVTNIADRKSRQMISKAAKASPEGIIVAAGCYIETRDEQLLSQEGINICIGNNMKSRLSELIEEYIASGKKLIIKDADIDNRYEDMCVTTSTEHTRCFIKVQDGCNQFCSYCIIPFARGRVRSRKEDDVIAEIEGLCSNGFSEFVITGIHLSSYGSDFEYEKTKADLFCPERLLHLLERVNALEGVGRIRLGSLEPRIITEDFVNGLKKISKLCPHFHLSLQSGAADTLKRMNRHYTKEEYREKCEILRAVFDHPAITTDVIVGFPGETDEEFAESRDFVKEIDFYEMHIFKYSKRHGTIAAGMDGQLTEKNKAERSHVLESLEKEMSHKYREYYIGKTVNVLFEETKEIDGKIYYVGHTKEYVKVACETEKGCRKQLAGLYGNVSLQGFLTDEYLIGDCISVESR